MWKQSLAVAAAAAAAVAARLSTSRRWFSTVVDVDFELRRAVEESFREVSMISPPPKKVNPPPSYSIVKGALERSEGPHLRRVYGDEEITLSVVRRALAIPSHGSNNGDGAEDHSPGFISELMLRVGVSRSGRSNSLIFLCGLYSDSVGIHSVCLLSKLNLESYQGRVFRELDEKLRVQLSRYLEDRGIDDRLFPFVQAWLYLKYHHNLVNWFGKLSQFVNGKNQHELVHSEVCRDKHETKANMLP